MVSIEYADGKHCYMDNRLYSDLCKIKKNLKNDEDYVLLIDGPERSGKSVLAQQIARFMDTSFTHKGMCIDVDEFSKGIDDSATNNSVVFDEGNRGFASDDASSVAKVLKSKFMEMGQKTTDYPYNNASRPHIQLKPQ